MKKIRITTHDLIIHPFTCLRLLVARGEPLDGDVGVSEGLLLRPHGRLELGAVLDVGQVLAAVGALPRGVRLRGSERRERRGGGRRGERNGVFALSLPES